MTDNRSDVGSETASLSEASGLRIGSHGRRILAGSSSALTVVGGPAAAGTLAGYTAYITTTNLLAFLSIAVAVGLGIATVVPRLPARPFHRLSKPSPLFIATFVGTSGSLAAAQVVNQTPAPSSYLTPILLWLASVALVAAAAVAPGLSWSGVVQFLRDHRAELGLVSILTATAALVRVVGLASHPWPFSGDEAAHALQAMRFDTGEIRGIFQTGLQGQPHAYYFALNLVMDAFGVTISGSRMFGVLLGVAAIPATYLFLRQAFGREVAIVGGIFVSGYHFVVHFSRMSLNNIGDVLVVALVLLFFLRAVSLRNPRDFVLTGLLLGLGLYVNIGARALIIVVALLMAFALVRSPRDYRQLIAGGAFLSAGFLVALAPLGFWWLDHPEQFNNRINSVGIYQSGWLDEHSAETGHSQARILWEQARQSFGAFGWFDDTSPHYRASIPLVDGVSLVFFLLGIAVAVTRLRRIEYFTLLVLFVVVVVTGGVLTVDPLNAPQRFLAAAPAVAAFVAVGVWTSITLIGRQMQARVHMVVALGIAVVLVSFNLYYYFVPYRTSDSYSDFNTRIVTEAGARVRNLSTDTDVYWYGGPRIFVGHPAFRWGIREYEVYDVLEDGEITPSPSDEEGSAAFFVMAHRKQAWDAVQEMCPGGRSEEVKDSEDRLLFYSYIAPADTDCARYASSLEERTS